MVSQNYQEDKCLFIMMKPIRRSQYVSLINLLAIQFMSKFILLLFMYMLKILAPQYFEMAKGIYVGHISNNISNKLTGFSKAQQNVNDNVNLCPVMLSCPLTNPLNDAVVTSKFGKREDPLNGTEKRHLGIDLCAAEGALIYAIMPGVVELAEMSPSFGNMVVLSHGNNVKSLYAHCKTLNVKKGEYINRGQAIGVIGNTGYYSTGTHLHLELIINGQQYDPEPLFKDQPDTDEI